MTPWHTGCRGQASHARLTQGGRPPHTHALHVSPGSAMATRGTAPSPPYIPSLQRALTDASLRLSEARGCGAPSAAAESQPCVAGAQSGGPWGPTPHPRQPPRGAKRGAGRPAPCFGTGTLHVRPVRPHARQPIPEERSRRLQARSRAGGRGLPGVCRAPSGSWDSEWDHSGGWRPPDVT